MRNRERNGPAAAARESEMLFFLTSSRFCFPEFDWIQSAAFFLEKEVGLDVSVDGLAVFLYGPGSSTAVKTDSTLL